MQHKLINTGDYLLIVDESKINQDDYIYRLSNKELEKANDEWLDDTHDDWKKIIAHLPLNNSPILEGVDLLPPRPMRLQAVGQTKTPVAFLEKGAVNGTWVGEYIY